MTDADQLLNETLAAHLAAEMADATAGHCVRIDDVEPTLADALRAELVERLPLVHVFVLRSSPESDSEIRPEQAVELRNRKTRPLLLLVPSGEGHAASSLDNSFHRLRMSEVFEGVDAELVKQLAGLTSLPSIRRLRRTVARTDHEAWAAYLAAVVTDPTDIGIGSNLWRVGLIPDLGPDPMSRADRNRVTVSAITRPSRPAATIDDRLSQAGVKNGAARAPLRDFLDQRGARLSNPILWTREIARHHDDLTFDKWVFADTPAQELDNLQVAPFLHPDGSVVRSSKLKTGADGQLILEVPGNATAPIAVTWQTEPPAVTGVSRWRLDVLRPADQRKDTEEAVASTMVAGKYRRGTVNVSVEEDDLDEGSQFVIVVTALGANGEELALTSGDPASVDSQEFQIVMGDQPETKTRRTAAASVPEAIVRSAIEGLNDLEQDLVSWDLPGQVFGLRLGNRRAVQVRVNEVLVKLQRDATETPNAAVHHVAKGTYGTVIDPPGEPTVELTLPNALKKVRAEFLKKLRASGPRDTVEAADWTDELRWAARAYAASYRRALEAADAETLRDLLLLDTLSLNVRQSNQIVRAVVVLPIHPLRSTWASTYDEVLRGWASDLTQIRQRGARAATLNTDLLTQVAPANLPFTALHETGQLAVYTEELTFGSGLYVVPGDLDTDTAADAVCSVLGIQRAASTVRASSRLLAERLRAYERTHEIGLTRRILAVNPGSGELVAGALTQLGSPLLDDEDRPDEAAKRTEIVAYADNTSYVRPVPALLAAQDEVRRRETQGQTTHLVPPLSVSVRPTDRMLTDTVEAHLSVIQDPGSSSVAFARGADRKPSFRDLLVPLVTETIRESGSVVWRSAPSVGNGSGDGELAALHRSHQRALGRLLSDQSDAVPTMDVTFDEETLAKIRMAHHRSEWVVGLDRFVGVNLFEQGLTEPYILDYAPDFVEGIGNRLTVTTTHRSEVEQLLAGAMDELGLDRVDSSVGVILETLTVVSGRLALRLLENTTQAREAVSLAALISYLRARDELADQIIIPVDAHPEIFGVAAREEGDARRCDLLLVKVGPRSFKVECVEVKSRKEAPLPNVLADTIVEQLHATRRVLDSRFFSDPPRIDAELQRARLNSLLHYYADRSASHGLISPDKLAETHRYIDRIEQSAERAEVSMRGYVVSLDGAKGFDKRYGDVPLTVLTAADLVASGLSVSAALQPETDAPPPSTPAVTTPPASDTEPSRTVPTAPSASEGLKPEMVSPAEPETSDAWVPTEGEVALGDDQGGALRTGG